MDAETFRTGIGPDGKPLQSVPVSTIAAANEQTIALERRIVDLLEANNRLVEERRERDARIVTLEANLAALQRYVAAFHLIPATSIVSPIGGDKFAVRLINEKSYSWGNLTRPQLVELVRQATEALDTGKWAGGPNPAEPVGVAQS